MATFARSAETTLGPAGAPSPALRALGIHAAALLCVLCLYLIVGRIPAVALCLTEGIVAWALSVRLRMPGWWQAINGPFFPLAWLASQSGIDPLWYLAAFSLLALTSLGSVRTRVPLWQSSARIPEELAQRLPPGLTLLDLGCGLGAPLAGLARLRPDLRLSGVEAAPLNWLITRLRLARRASIRLGSLWDEDLSRHDVVYAYLSPAPMARLWEKARREMPPGSLFVSNGFGVPGVMPDEVIDLDDAARSRLLLWRMA